MPIIEYTPDCFEKLRETVSHLEGGAELLHRTFVDYYYATSDFCHLFLFVSSAAVVEGMVGVELLEMQAGSEGILAGFASNFFSTRHSAGSFFLFRKWLNCATTGIVFGGSSFTHQLIRAQRWTYYEGINTYILNNPYLPRPNETKWRGAAKYLLRNLPGVNSPIGQLKGRLPRAILSRVSAREETDYREDLLPAHSPFTFRFAPTVEHLAWRYNTRLSFVRYRLFRIISGNKPAGYVIVKDSPDALLVSQCDGTDPEVLAYGVLLSLLEVAHHDKQPRSVTLACTHPVMQQIYVSFGFRAARQGRPFALGAWRKTVEVPPDTSSWLINLDWGDNGLRVPFADQLTAEPA